MIEEKPISTEERPTPQKSPSMEERAISPKNMMYGLALTAIISGYIMGPLLLIGGAGWWVYTHFQTSKLVLFGAVLIAFIVSNFLIFVRSKRLLENFSKKTNTNHQ